MNPIILYVEDDKESRAIMKVLLEDVMGLSNITIFENSENFIARVEALNPQPNVILLDIHVPPYSGFEMLKMLRAHSNYQNLPIVALTASVMNEEVNQLKGAGFDGIMAKPLDIDTFPMVLQQIMSGESVWTIIE